MKNWTGDSKLSVADHLPGPLLMDNWDSSEFDTSTPTTESPKPPPSGRAFWYVCGALLVVIVMIVSSGPSYEIVVDQRDPRFRHIQAEPPPESSTEPVAIPVEPAPQEAMPVEPDPGVATLPATPVPPVVQQPYVPSAPPVAAEPPPPIVPGHAPAALNQMIAQLEPSVVYLYSDQGDHTFSGTGFVINGSGLIATNAHVVTHSERPGVMTSKHQSFQGRVVARAPNEDLALVQADLPPDIQPLRLGDSDQIRLGDDIVVMGFPVGLFSKVSVATGIIGSIRAEENRVQLSMAINPGNSGGPVFSRTTGEVVAVVVSKHARAEGMGFSIPVNVLKQFLAESGH